MPCVPYVMQYVVELVQNLTWAAHTAGSAEASDALAAEVVASKWPGALSGMMRFNKAMHRKQAQEEVR